MEQAESNLDSLRVFTTEKWFVQSGMAVCGTACWFRAKVSVGHGTHVNRSQLVTDSTYAAFTALDPFFEISRQGLAGLVDGDLAKRGDCFLQADIPVLTRPREPQRWNAG